MHGCNLAAGHHHGSLNKEEMCVKVSTNPKHGKFIGAGICLGVAIGCAIGVAIGNLALGIGPGIAIGVGIGALMSKWQRQ